MTEPRENRATGNGLGPPGRLVARRRWLRRLVIILGVTTGLWLIVSSVVAYRLTRRPHPPFPQPPPSVGWGKFESYRLRTRDGEEIGAWFLPGEDSAPSVLLIHGNRGSRWNCLDRAEILARRGFSVLLISLRAHGDSTGKFNDVGYSARHDIITAVEFLEQRRPGKPVIAYGMSLGAAAAIFASGTLAHRVQGYILESPYRDLKVAVRNRIRTYLPPVLEWVAYQGLLTVSPLVLPELDKISPLTAIAGIPRDVPVLLLAGGKDRVARPEETRMLYDRVSAHGTLIVFEGSDHHNLLETASDRYTRCVLAFVDAVRSRGSAKTAGNRD
jgi:uncharacterized protein